LTIFARKTDRQMVHEFSTFKPTRLSRAAAAAQALEQNFPFFFFLLATNSVEQRAHFRFCW